VYRERLAWSPLIKVYYVNYVKCCFVSLVLIGGAGEGLEIKWEMSLEGPIHCHFAIVYRFELELGAGSLC